MQIGSLQEALQMGLELISFQNTFFKLNIKLHEKIMN
jgi:hypothetical protein